MALGGYELFHLFHIKGDFWGSVGGSAAELQPEIHRIVQSPMGLKDIFLIGFFFLSIGFTALPTFEMAGMALILVLVLPVKAIMFFFFRQKPFEG